ncbi:S-adenosyl-L-methionine-dependent methyltransferase protein [Rutstroemia sp. NJR-2017a BVV2]|nr:S-adenosyl-L-methionine-dependent methyltransferase protein [Rutstroemia sp. NJR-2017a BVV2]
MDAVATTSVQISLKGTDINEKAVEVYKSRIATNSWPAEGLQMDSNKLEFADNNFIYSIGNAFLFVLPNDGIDAMKEYYRTLKSGGTLIVNSRAYVPNMEPIHAVAKATRSPGTPLPRDGFQRWSPAEFLRDVVEKGGFEKDKITLGREMLWLQLLSSHTLQPCSGVSLEVRQKLACLSQTRLTGTRLYI